MAIVLTRTGSYERLERLAAPQPAVPTLSTGRASSTPLWSEGDPYTYAMLYRTQPNVRTCVDFLARNMAQLGIHAFRRLADTDRERLAGHDVIDWLEHPTPWCTRYRLIETLMQDLGIFYSSYWLKVRLEDRIGLQRLPPEQVLVAGGLVPSFFRWTTLPGNVYDFPVSEIVHVTGYNPANPLSGLAPLETLRQVLAEDIASMAYRESYWGNASRIEGVIERPLAANTGRTPWGPPEIEAFREMWQGRYAGVAGTGKVPVLVDGMTFKPVSFSAKQSEYVPARKLTREEVASAYHIPLPFVGILDHATFSNVKEQHKQLYADTLGPWCEQIVLEFERQLLPESADSDRVYFEFNISEKLKGSFEEQAVSLHTLVGAPVMTRNEARARLNLPAIDEDGADSLVRPLNTTAAGRESSATPPTAPAPDDAEAIDVAPVIERAWKRQASALAKLEPAHRAAAFGANVDRWTRELVADLEPIYRQAGHDAATAERRAVGLAHVVNSDTLTLLRASVAAFAPHREAGSYVA